MTVLDPVATGAAPEPLGHYSQAVVTPDGAVWVSAQLPLGGDVSPGSAVAEQARRALANVVAIVRAAGSAVDSIVKITVYLADISDWEAVDAVVAEMIGEHRPARSVLQISGLHHGFRVAVDAVAARIAL